MKKILSNRKSILSILLMLCFACTVQAQNKTKRIGNRPRSGSANSSFDMVKGYQVAVKMNAGHKPVQLLQLNFDAENVSADSIKFKVNVYEFDGITPGENLIKQDVIGTIPEGKNRVNVNLEPYNITAKGSLLVAVEWLKSGHAENHFAIGLFNGGTYLFKNNQWKKVPVAGVDFNMLVRKLSRA